MGKRIFDATAPFQGISSASRLTGLSRGYIREGCKRGDIPYVMCGKEYRVNMPKFLEMLNRANAEQAQAAPAQ